MSAIFNPITSVTFSRSGAPIYTQPMSVKSATSRILCAQCEKPEARCECEKYCILCQSQVGVRLCTDGLLYCEPCREACDYKTVD